jgi:hypothetical protein
MSTMESADDCSGLVVQIDADWRIIECRDRQQWILQRRGSPKKPRANDWRGRSYCRTAEALRRCTRDYVGTIDPNATQSLDALPPFIDSAAGATNTRLRRPATDAIKRESQP